jgi:hypothetical protein
MHTADTNTTTEQNEVFNYQVEQVRLFTPNNEPTRFFGNRRIDTGDTLGVTSKKYNILQNSDLFSTAENLFRDKGLTNYERKFVVTHGGSRARAVYRFPQLGIKVNNQDLTFALKVQNSFDGSLRASFVVGLFRLICANGMTVPHKQINLSQKHTSNLSLENMGVGLEKAIASFHHTAPVLEGMAKMRLTQLEGKAIIDNLVKGEILSDRMAEGVRSIWENPTYEEDGERNLWNLFNATTQHLTHNVATKRFDLAERVEIGVYERFQQAVQLGNTSNLVWANN